MNIEEIRDFCLQLPGTEEGFPFDETTLVFKIGGKIYALLGLEKQILNIKALPENNIELRENFAWIIEGYHMNKKHWSTILLNEHPDPHHCLQLIKESYKLIIKTLSKKQRTELGF